MRQVELQMIFPTGSDGADGTPSRQQLPSLAGVLGGHPVPDPQNGPRAGDSTAMWNGKNGDPIKPLGLDECPRPGGRMHLNFASAYGVLPKRLRLGISSFHLERIRIRDQ